MRKMLLISAALLAVLAGPAMAQRGEHGRGGGDEHGHRGGPPAAAQHTPPAAAPRAAPQAAAPAAPAPTQQAQRPQSQNRLAQGNGGDRRDAGRRDNNSRPDANRGGSNSRPDANRSGSNGRPDFNRGGNNGRPDFNRGGNNGRPDFNRGGSNNRSYSRSGDHRPSQRNWSQYHRNFTASRRFHFRGGNYRRPAGWYYRRWTFGQFLPSLFWSSNYWINDFRYYDLPAPPPGAVWVRYGDDALLIDRFSGEIIQVEYGIFF